MEKFCKKVCLSALAFLASATKMIFIVPRGTCRFSPSCSDYAREAVETLPLHRAAILIALRLLRCTPFSAGGVDPVPRQGGKGFNQ